MGSGVAVGGSGVEVAVAVAVGSGPGGKNEAHAENPSAKQRVNNMQMSLRWKNIAPIIN
jgi:hypothetical protein